MVLPGDWGCHSGNEQATRKVASAGSADCSPTVEKSESDKRK